VVFPYRGGGVDRFQKLWTHTVAAGVTKDCSCTFLVILHALTLTYLMPKGNLVTVSICGGFEPFVLSFYRHIIE